MSIGVFTHPVDPHVRTEARRHRLIAVANRAGWPELERRHLRFGAFSTVVDERDQTEYSVYRGSVDEAIGPKVPVDAFYFDQGGAIVFLEKRPNR